MWDSPDLITIVFLLAAAAIFAVLFLLLGLCYWTCCWWDLREPAKVEQRFRRRQDQPRDPEVPVRHQARVENDVKTLVRTEGNDDLAIAEMRERCRSIVLEIEASKIEVSDLDEEVVSEEEEDWESSSEDGDDVVDREEEEEDLMLPEHFVRMKRDDVVLPKAARRKHFLQRGCQMTPKGKN